MSRLLPVLTAIPLLITVGIAEGLWTDRWASSAEAEQAAVRLQEVPLTVGDWVGEAQEMDARQVAKAEVNGYLLRRYVHRSTGAALTLLVVCGRPGPVSVHTPDVCYGGAGYRLMAPPIRQPVEAGDQRAEFWVGQFQKEDAALPDNLRIFWSWNAARPWIAADQPRFQFASSRALYKLYVVRQVARSDVAIEKDAGVDFLRLFLPQLDRCLFPTPHAD